MNGPSDSSHHTLPRVGSRTPPSTLVLFTSIDSVIAIGHIVALVAMPSWTWPAVVLARRGFPGTGFRIPGGPAIPIVAGVACLTQFFSFGLTDILAAAAMLLGLALDSMRHRNLFAEEALDEIRDASAISRRRSPVR